MTAAPIVPIVPLLVDAIRGAADRALDPKHVQHGALSIIVDYLPGETIVALRIPYPTAPLGGDGGPYRGGAFTRAQLSAKRPLFLKFEPESDQLRIAKRDGINRELQTGDALFDDAVYVDAPCDDATVLEILQPQVRSAIRALLAAGASEIGIDHQGGHVTVQFVDQRERSEADARAILDAFVALVGALPPLDKVGEQPAPEGRFITTLLIVTLFAITFAIVAGVVSVIRGGHAFLGAAAGFVGGLPLIALPRYRGRSNSAAQRSLAGGLLVFVATSVGAIIGAFM